MTFLAWGGVDYKQKYKKAGEWQVLLNTIKWGTDYLIKCHTAPNEFYVQVNSNHFLLNYLPSSL